MNAGLPGTGIGGLFYIATALWMPVHRAFAGGSRGGRDWRRIGAQMSIAAGILVALALTAAVLGRVIAPSAVEVARAAAGGAPTPTTQVFHWLALAGTAGILLLLVTTVELARVVVARGERRLARLTLTASSATSAAAGDGVIPASADTAATPAPTTQPTNRHRTAA